MSLRSKKIRALYTMTSQYNMFLFKFRFCPQGWSGLNGRCFRLFNGPLTQTDAQNDCVAKNSTLANSNTEEKLKLFQTLVSNGKAFVSNFIIYRKYYRGRKTIRLQFLLAYFYKLFNVKFMSSSTKGFLGTTF